MSKYRLLKDLPWVDAGAEYIPENDDPHYYNYNGASYINRLFIDDIANNPEWFQKIEERIEVHLVGSGMAGEVTMVRPLQAIHGIPREKFPEIKKAIEDVLNDKGDIKIVEAASYIEKYRYDNTMTSYRMADDILKKHSKII